MASNEQPELPAKRCQNCKFWKRETVGGKGWCFRRAPVAAHGDTLAYLEMLMSAVSAIGLHLTQEDQSDWFQVEPDPPEAEVYFPRIHGSQWCGDFKRKKHAKAA